MTRQPIFDTGRQTVGYELKAHLPEDDAPADAHATSVCRQTIHQALHVIGLDTLLGRARMFIPVTPEIMEGQDYMVLPPERTCLKVPQELALSRDMLTANQRARQAGYTLAVEADPDRISDSAMRDIAQIVRVDFPSMAGHEVNELVKMQDQGGPSLLAASIDTHDDLSRATQLGVKYVQGYFFSQPVTTGHRALTTPQVIQLKFLSELSKPQLDFDSLEKIIKSDVALMTHLLRYMNSAAQGMRQRITSVKKALALLGERAVRKWGALVAITALGTGSPHELLLTSLVRARFCELLAIKLRREEESLDAFLTGLFSTLDVMLQLPMEQAIGSLPVSQDVRQTLLGQHDSALGMIYGLACATERGGWASVIELGNRLFLPQQEVASLYYQTLRWTDEFFQLPAA